MRFAGTTGYGSVVFLIIFVAGVCVSWPLKIADESGIFTTPAWLLQLIFWGVIASVTAIYALWLERHKTFVLVQVPESLLGMLRAAHAVQPVYRCADAVLVALPEVRVEESRPDRLRLLHAWLDARGSSIEVSEPESGRITLRPASGDAEEALAIANALQEEITPELAEARFIRSVESPDKVKARARAPRRP